MELTVTKGEILEGSIPILLLKLSAPTALALSLNALFNVVDRAYISHIGDIEFAAIGIAFILQSVIACIAMGIGDGVNSVISRWIGADNYANASHAALFAIILCILLSVGTCIIGLATLDLQVSLLDLSKEMSAPFQEYLKVIYIGSFSIYTPIILNSILRAKGNMIAPMKVMMIGAIINLILDPVLIFGLYPIKPLGAMGAAIATISARFFAVIYCLFLLHRHCSDIFKLMLTSIYDSILKLANNDNHTSYDIVAIGLSSAISNMINPTLLIIYIVILIPYGDSAKVAFTAGLTFGLLVMFPVSGLCKATITAVAQNIGANTVNRVEHIFIYSFFSSAIFVSICSALVLTFSEEFLTFFINEKESLEIAEFTLYYFSVVYIFSAMINIQTAYLQALNRPFGALFLKAISLSSPIASISMDYIFGGLHAIWIGYVAPNILAVAIGAFVIRFPDTTSIQKKP